MPFYSNESRMLQSKFDSVRLADQLKLTRRHSCLTSDDRDMIQGASHFFMASADDQGRPDCSVKGGNPGFVTCVNESTISFLNYDGNGMFRSLGNVLSNPWVGLLFVDFGPDTKKLRINGRARFSQENVELPTQIKVIVDIDDIFPNCPRYLSSFETGVSSVYNPKSGYTPPAPHWKSKPDLEPFLPNPSTNNQEN